MEDRNYRLIVAYFDKTIDDDGLAELKEWLESSPAHQEMFSETIHILSASRTYFTPPENTASNWARIQAHLAAGNSAASGQEASDTTEDPAQPAPKRLYLTRRWMAAAMILIIAAAGLITYQQHQSTQPAVSTEYAQFSNPHGTHSTVHLPDGSVIHLGAGSKIRYEKSFTAAKRVVSLDGEAFFEVVHHATRPFIVQSGSISTVVLGTSFNVKAFSAKKRVAVTVKSGKVGVVSYLNGKSRMLSTLLPDEQLEINTLSGDYESGRTDAAAVIGWMNNNFVYYNSTLKEITESLSRHYGVNIVFARPELGEVKLTAKFNNMPLSEISANLSQLSGLYFSKKGNEIRITDHQQKRREHMK